MLFDGPVLLRGRGEVVEEAALPASWWVLVPQSFAVATADAYRWWDEDGGPIAAQRRVPGLGVALGNDLEPAVLARHPDLGRVEDLLVEHGAVAAILCGSGPTVAGLAPGEDEARRIAASVPGAIAVSAPP